MKAINIVADVYKDFSKITKTVIKYGLISLTALYTIAIATYLLAGISFDYYWATMFAQNLAESVCRCVGALGIGVVLLESVPKQQ